ncbi:unnamed protein product, partial [Cyprideis torosa]
MEQNDEYNRKERALCAHVSGGPLENPTSSTSFKEVASQHCAACLNFLQQPCLAIAKPARQRLLNLRVRAVAVNFEAVPYDDAVKKGFHTGDSYIVLSTVENNGVLSWNVHFWLGSETSQV